MDPNSKIDFYNLIHNQEFIDWVVSPNQESDLHWNQIIQEYPANKAEIDSAIFIIKSLLKEEKELDSTYISTLWERIQKGTTKRKKIIPFTRWIAAASILLLIGISGAVFYQLKYKINSGIDYQSVARIEPSGNEVKLIFSDKTERLLSSNNSEIKYTKDGQIQISSDGIITEQKEKSDKEERLNQLVVPLGKRTVLTLSDGTVLWLNSGSRAIYPVKFTKKTREIYVEGEAFLEVAHNADWPFVVVANHIKVKVLGTKFNISSYPNDLHSSIVLVEGSIQAIIESKKVLMKENQLLIYENNSGITSVKEANVLEYISWKDGWMYCNKEKLENIAIKLSRYYNIEIQFKDFDAKNLTLTGKLDLKNNIEEIFKAICSTAPVSFEVVNGGFSISENKNNQ